MPKIFLKTKDCGCIIQAIANESQTTSTGKVYIIDSHTHFHICDICKILKESGEDTLHDMRLLDNITNKFEYANWKEQNTS